MERIDNEFNITEMGAQNAPTQNIEWQGRDIEYNTGPLIDGNYGGAKVIRTFELELPKGMPVSERVSNEEMLDYHGKKIKMFLWKDGLEQDGPMKLVYNKIDPNKFAIIVVAKPKAGATLLETPMSLNNL